MAERALYKLSIAHPTYSESKDRAQKSLPVGEIQKATPEDNMAQTKGGVMLLNTTPGLTQATLEYMVMDNEPIIGGAIGWSGNAFCYLQLQFNQQELLEGHTDIRHGASDAEHGKSSMFGRKLELTNNKEEDGEALKRGFFPAMTTGKVSQEACASTE